MDKHYLGAMDMLDIATQHAYCAEYLLQQNAEVKIDNNVSIDGLLPITTLIYMAFELTLKAYLLHDSRDPKQYKNLSELVELNPSLDLSKQDRKLISSLSRQHAFRKGIDYLQWGNRQQLQVFCEQLLHLYAQLEAYMPLELRGDYQ